MFPLCKNHVSPYAWALNTGLALLATASLTLPVSAQTPLEIRGRGSDRLVFPNGAASFADKVTSFQPGTPLPVEKARDADQALGVPDFHSVQDTGYVSLGRGGVITVEFVDNRLVDVPGNDLYIFEVGPEVESTFVGSVRTERPGPR